MSTLAVDAAAADSRADPADESPLSDDERKLVARLLSDPFSFPQVFKTWVVSFLEGSDLTLPLSSILGLSSLLGTTGGGASGIFKLLPAGMLFPWAGPTAPNGTFLCDGSAKNRVTYKRLFDVTGTRWGAGDGLTTFNIPDIRRRVPWGAGAGVGVGSMDGLPEDQRSISHHHAWSGSFGAAGYNTLDGGTDWEGDHGHGLAGGIVKGINPADQDMIIPQTGGGGVFNVSAAGGHDHGVSVGGTVNVTGSVGGNTSGSAPSDAPSYAVVTWIVNY